MRKIRRAAAVALLSGAMLGASACDINGDGIDDSASIGFNLYVWFYCDVLQSPLVWHCNPHM